MIISLLEVCTRFVSSYTVIFCTFDEMRHLRFLQISRFNQQWSYIHQSYSFTDGVGHFQAFKLLPVSIFSRWKEKHFTVIFGSWLKNCWMFFLGHTKLHECILWHDVVITFLDVWSESPFSVFSTRNQLVVVSLWAGFEQVCYVFHSEHWVELRPHIKH